MPKRQTKVTQYERDLINKQERSMGYYAQSKVIRRKFFLPAGAPEWIDLLINDRHYKITKSEYLKIKQYYQYINNC